MGDGEEVEQGQKIGLAETIETLRSELETAQMQGAARAVAFGVEKVELELKVAVSRKLKTGGGIKFWVVSAEGGRRGRKRDHPHVQSHAIAARRRDEKAARSRKRQPFSCRPQEINPCRVPILSDWPSSPGRRAFRQGRTRPNQKTMSEPVTSFPPTSFLPLSMWFRRMTHAPISVRVEVGSAALA